MGVGGELWPQRTEIYSPPVPFYLEHATSRFLQVLLGLKLKS